MSEMLGNQYFLARKFKSAVDILEKECIIHPENRKILKKLVICYSQVGRIEDCLELFLKIVTDEPELIINTDIEREDCPCPVIIENMKKEIEANLNSVDFFNVLGALSLFIDKEQSLEYFKKSISIQEQQQVIHSIIKVLSNI